MITDLLISNGKVWSKMDFLGKVNTSFSIPNMFCWCQDRPHLEMTPPPHCGEKWWLLISRFRGATKYAERTYFFAIIYVDSYVSCCQNWWLQNLLGLLRCTKSSPRFIYKVDIFRWGFGTHVRCYIMIYHNHLVSSYSRYQWSDQVILPLFTIVHRDIIITSCVAVMIWSY